MSVKTDHARVSDFIVCVYEHDNAPNQTEMTAITRKLIAWVDLNDVYHAAAVPKGDRLANENELLNLAFIDKTFMSV